MPKDDSDRSDAHSDPPSNLIPSTLLSSSSDRTTIDSGVAPPGVQFPGYTLLAELNRGGQGIVYQAIQAGTNRKVAIKISLERAGPDDVTARRFEREVELAGRLAHPNIISVFHSGRTPDGRDFFVMDYVRGSSLTRYVRERRLTLTEALEVFARVCDGVQFAHQRGIIHRDLKPSNILVQEAPAEHAREVEGDERILGTPRILDFGLAKWMAAPAGPPISRSHVLVGTLPYMAPEQVRGNPDEIDTRTDIYALGLILYELLTGCAPYPVRGNTDDVMRNITSMEPTPPSRAWKPDVGVAASRGSRTGSSTRSASALRRFSLRRLRPLRSPIDDEVQTIVLKALAKERERRYQSTAELARDIRHYLAGEPIDAKRDSGLYILGKLLRRYRVHATIAAAFVLLIVGMYVLYSRQRIERARADAALHKSQAGFAFLNDVFGGADPATQTGRRDITAADLLDRAVAYIDKQVDSESRGADPAIRRGREAAWAEQRSIVGRLFDRYGLYERSERQLRLALEMREQNPETTPADLAVSYADVGHVLADQGKHSEAEPFVRRALELQKSAFGADSPDVAIAQVDLGSLLARSKRVQEAVPQLRSAVSVLQKHFGSEHSRTLEARNELGLALRDVGETAEAESILGELLAIKQRLVGPEHLDTGVAWQNVSRALAANGKLDQAVEAARRAVEIYRKTLSDEHLYVAGVLLDLAQWLRKAGRREEAEPALREARTIYRANPGMHPGQLGVTLNELGLVLRETKRAEAAIPIFREALEADRRADGQYENAAAFPLHNLALALRDLGRTDDAIQSLRDAIAVLVRSASPDSASIAHMQITLGATLVHSGAFEEAEYLLVKNYEAPVGPASRDVAINALVELYEATNRPEQAAHFRAMRTATPDPSASGPTSQSANDR